MLSRHSLYNEGLREQMDTHTHHTKKTGRPMPMFSQGSRATCRLAGTSTHPPPRASCWCWELSGLWMDTQHGHSSVVASGTLDAWRGSHLLTWPPRSLSLFLLTLSATWSQSLPRCQGETRIPCDKEESQRRRWSYSKCAILWKLWCLNVYKHVPSCLIKKEDIRGSVFFVAWATVSTGHNSVSH